MVGWTVEMNMGYGDSNTFHGLRVVNTRRCEESYHPVAAWSPCDWMTAVAGEVGEAANLVKKLRRLETDGIETPQNEELKRLVTPQVAEHAAPSDLKVIIRDAITRRIAHELADVVIYIDLLAARLGIDLGQAVIEKFNMTSQKIGSKETLPY